MSKKSILNHVLVPEHYLLTKKEEKLFLEEKGLNKEDLPILKKEDPVVDLIKAKKGDIVKMKRRSVFGGSYYYYRLVE